MTKKLNPAKRQQRSVTNTTPKLNEEQGEGGNDGGGNDDEPRRDKMGEQGVMMTMRVGKVVRRVVMTMRKVVRAMRREENTTTRDSLASEGERPRGRFWGL